MTRKTLLAVAVLAATGTGGAAFADSNHGHGAKSGPGDRAGMMMQGCSGMMGVMGGMSGMMDMMQRMHGGMMGGGMAQMLDADGDRAVTPGEMRTQLQAKLTEYDSDGDDALSIAEFETLHSAMIREMMVDRFQHLDADGDGSVTTEEMTAPADKMERMQSKREGMMQTRPGNGADMGNGTMMDDK